MKNARKRLFAVLALVLVIGLAAGIVAYAEFVKSSRAKRVVASYGDEGSLFSSNYLVENTNPAANVYKRLFYTMGEGIPAHGDVTICNYAQGNPVRTYESDIEYVLTARFMILGESNGSYVKTNATAENVGDHTVSISLKGGEPVTLSSSRLSYTFPAAVLDHRATATDLIHLEFDGSFHTAGALCLYLSAVPTKSQAGVHTLDAVCGVALNTGEARNIWEGEFNEKSMGQLSPQQPNFDGFNYLISGTGKGTCTLTWNNTKLQISQVFLTQQQLTPSVSGNLSSVTFPVDSDVLNRYDLQFYYVDGSGTFSSWNELTGGAGGDGYVKLLYVEDNAP